MTQISQLEQFLEFEEEQKLFQLTHKGVSYWQFIRFYIFSEIQFGQAAGQAHPDMNNKTFIQKLGYLPHAFGQVKHYFDKREYDVFFTYSYMRREIDGKMINPYIQFIQDGCSFAYKNHTLFSGNWVQDLPDGSNNALWELMWLPLFAGIKLMQKNGLKDITELKQTIELLNKEFNCKLDYRKYLDRVFQNVLKFKWIKSYYKHILMGKYKLIFMGCHYSLENYALVAAARECSIPTVEHQHGVIGKYHISYNFKDKRKTGKYLPDFLLTFGDYWSETCRLPDYVTPISVGSPLMDYSKARFKDSIKEEKTVMFISNGLIGATMSKLAMKFAELAMPQGYRILYKFHPNECRTWRERYPWLSEDKNIEFVDRPINVHELLATTKHIVSVGSTVVFEALAFNDNVYIWNKDMMEYIEDFTKIGIAPIFEDENDLFGLIKNSGDAFNSEISESIYKPESIINIGRTFNKILSCNGGNLNE